MRSRERDGLCYGLYMPNFGRELILGSWLNWRGTRRGLRLDGFFLWDHLVEWDKWVPIYDSFTSLAATAVNTERIRLGTTVTPQAKTKQWLVARQMATLDHLSNGRMILGVGLGTEESTNYERFGEVVEDRILTEKLDESLDIMLEQNNEKPWSVCKPLCEESIQPGFRGLRKEFQELTRGSLFGKTAWSV